MPLMPAAWKVYLPGSDVFIERDRINDFKMCKWKPKTHESPVPSRVTHLPCELSISDSQTGVGVPPGVQTRTFRGTRKKNWIMAGKGYLFKVTAYKFAVTASVLITNVLLIWRVQ